ncbi:glycosyltransferase [uncultured Paracoccus sp.]|uniref:glycosyltransferase family 2 protein n=1 Tax=uncultured Paracoccus sp. TaxID=189685 RepID=UPI00262BC0D8|nr:glycosyltransferase [uncultured Paracoccus sp.]
MGFGLRDLEIDDLPARLPFAERENGIGLILRDQGRLVGFELIDRPPGIDWIDPSVFAGSEVREAAAVERWRARMPPAPGPAPSISIAICSKDRYDWVDRLLRSLEPYCAVAPDAPEVLVIDNASTDPRLHEICVARDWVRYVQEPLVGLDFARNRALREARGEVVAFLDDDVVVDRNWLWALRRAWAENPDAGCVTGLVLPMFLDTEAQILFERGGGFRRGFRPIRYGPDRFGDAHYPFGAGRFGAGANMSVRRRLVLDLGGFDEALDTGRPLPGGGDLDIFYRVLRAGAMLVYDPQVAVYHEHRRERAVLRRQYYTWGLGFAAFIQKSVEADPTTRVRFRRLLLWWVNYHLRRMRGRLRRRNPMPMRMILAELWGGIIGLGGEYGRSQRRIAAIKAAAAETRPDLRPKSASSSRPAS